jgi:hypothetical protein
MEKRKGEYFPFLNTLKSFPQQLTDQEKSGVPARKGRDSGVDKVGSGMLGRGQE